MLVLEAKQDVPLAISDDGAIRIAGTRVSLESVLHHYRQGATAEEIALRFPALRLADIHSCLAYYLNRQEKVEDYIVARRREANGLKSAFRLTQCSKAALTRCAGESRSASQPGSHRFPNASHLRRSGF